jgi:polysaccharide chain length determinant protein (PEP-CTERM system associated)
VNSFVPQAKEVLRGLWQGRWIGLVVAWVAGLGGATYVFMTPDRYEATARVYVDTQSILRPLLSGLTVQPNVEQEVALLSRTLISRPNLQKLVRMTDMDLHVKTNEERERLIDDLMRTLYIRGVGQANLYIIGFTHPNPAEAGRVVQSLLSIFVESGLSAKSNDAGQAKRFIEDQIKAYEQKLTEAENRVKEFKLRNMDLAGPEGRDFFSSMAAVSEQRREAQLALQEAERSRDALKKMIADEGRQPPAASGAAQEPAEDLATPELDERLSALNKNLDEMLLRYTENHPDVVNTRRIVKEVEAQRKEERKRLAEQSKRRGPGPLAEGGYGSQLKISLAEAEAQVAGLQARVADFERRLARLREQARSVPEREAEFARLNRDYGIQKQNYQNLVARRESAEMSADMGAATGFADFRIIDPPRVSPTPVSPNRKMLVPLVLLAALAAGLAASYLFSVVHPTFHDNRSLKRVGQRPVLGAVSLVLNPEIVAMRHRKRLLFFGGVGTLAATYLAVIGAVFLRGLLPF